MGTDIVPAYEPRKVIISPSFGAGWSTWNDKELADDFLFDAELIDAIESGVYLGHDDRINAPEPDANTPLGAFLARLKEKHGEDEYYCLLGARDLVVVEVRGPFIVEEYDGSESLRFKHDTEWR